MNLKTVQEFRAQGESAVYGDASLRRAHHAGIEHADGLIIAASSAPADTIVKAAREPNSNIRVLTRATYLKESQKLREAGANAVFSSEGEVALAMTAFLMRQLEPPMNRLIANASACGRNVLKRSNERSPRL